MKVEVHVLAVDLGKEVDKVPDAAAQAINRPSGNDVEFAPGNALQHTAKLRPLVPPNGPANGVIDILADNAVSAQTADRRLARMRRAFP